MLYCDRCWQNGGLRSVVRRCFVRVTGFAQNCVGRMRSPGNFRLHAVTVGTANDSVVMRGIATVGGGSIRSIGGEQTPQIAAQDLLNEIAQPGLRDLNVEFRGLKVAAVYPERLPNVAAGTQQILVGRYTLVTRLTRTFDTAHRHQLSGTTEAVNRPATAVSVLWSRNGISILLVGRLTSGLFTKIVRTHQRIRTAVRTRSLSE